MTSTGSGPYRVGGSLGSLSSSSNLSPLAPPFKVDRSLQKQNSTNTCLNYPDVLMYGPYFDSPAHTWNHSSSSSATVGVNVTCSSSPTTYGYSASQSSSTAANVYDPFSYDPFPNSISAVSEGVKSYYPPYVAPPQKDGFLSLGVSSGDHYDLQSSSVDRKLDWGSVWSGGNEQSKWSEYGQRVGSKDSNLFDSQSSRSPLLDDGNSKSQPSTEFQVLIHPFADRRSSTTNIPAGDGSLDDFLWRVGTQQDTRSFLGGLRLPTSDSLSIPKESSNLQGPPVVESVTNFCGSKNGNGLSLGNHFSQSGAYVFGSTTPSGTTKNKSLYGGSSSSVEEGIFSAPKLNPDASVVAKESNISAGYDYSYPVEPRIPVGLKRQSSIVIRRPPSSSVGPSSSQIGESSDATIGIKNVTKKSQVSPQMSHHFSSAGLDLEVNDAQAAYPVDNFSDVTEVHNPAEDSPCWKGASSSFFSPFAVSKGMLSDVCVKKLDEPKSTNTQVPMLTSFPVNSSGFVSECTPKDNEESYSATRQPLCFDLNTRDGVQFADESYTSTKEYCILKNSETDARPEFTLPAIQISDEGECPIHTLPVVDVASSSENNQASSPPAGDNANLGHCQVTSKFSESNVDVNMLLKTLLNLSERLRCCCFSKRDSVPEQHSIAIKQIIGNLNASMLMMTGETSSNMSTAINSFKQQLPVAQMVNNAAFEAVSAAVKAGGEAEGLLDSISCTDGPNSIRDSDMMEAIKKVLHENFRGEEEMDEQRLLYKNLWLDAEASLCAMTAKARFLRVKADMEKTLDGAEDKEVLSPSDDIPDSQAVDGNSSEFRVPTATKETTLRGRASDVGNSSESKEPTATKEETRHGSDVDASVMARYQILKRRIQTDEAPSQENKGSFEGHQNPDNPVVLTSPSPSPSPCEYDYMPDRESSSPVYQTLECGADSSDSFPDWLSKSVGDIEVGEAEASVMARFRIIQSRIHIQEPDSVVLGSSEQQGPTLRGAFGPYPNLVEEDESDDPISYHVNEGRGTYLTQPIKTNRINSEIFESWYGNDGPSSDWEHVSKDDLRKTN